MQVQLPAGQVQRNQMNQAVQPTVLIVSPQQQNQQGRTCFNKSAAVKLGSVQIILGILAIAFNAAALGVRAAMSDFYHGIWSGVIFILAGAFQIAAGKTNNKCWIITSMVFAILAAVFSIPVLGICAVGIPIDQDKYRRHSNYYGSDYYYGYEYYHRKNPDKDLSQYQAGYAINGTLVAIAVLEGIIAIIAAACACKAVCCRGTSQSATVAHQVLYVANPSQPGQQMMVLAPITGNQVVYPNQPSVLGQTMRPARQVLSVQTVAGTKQTGFTAPVLTATGAPPAYSSLQVTPLSAPTPAVPEQPPEYTAKF